MEKLIVVSIEDEIVDSYIGIVEYLSEYSYLEILDIMEFEGFVFVEAKFK